jgi:hypothetical protein
MIGEPGAASGDSGAADLVNFSADTFPTVIGVHVASTFDLDGLPSSGQEVRLQPHAFWIGLVVRQAAKEGGYRPPEWAEACIRDGLCPLPPQ